MCQLVQYEACDAAHQMATARLPLLGRGRAEWGGRAEELHLRMHGNLRQSAVLNQ